ncbi:type II toxin-antitoxin system prevent-host-death family antitoxin [Luteimonas marina]|uniref:Antitoxin n=1 Tax=Luteimonas marina TaxID=488485 RepID=A0A5C5U3M6_9GAMM|nr:type II toxin-antitoxin system prevent-host-death family antitoxin [Luteimonas marina]TWT21081.1 type II toxin-antitoxin system prevent-host-death family antitoxin [Luteimonas marina]
MTSVPLAEAKNRLSELISRAEAGEEISVTRRGKAVAKLVAFDAAETGARRERVTEAFGRLRALREQLDLEGDLKSIAREGLD